MNVLLCIVSSDRREAKKGFGDDVPEQVWAAAQRNTVTPRPATDNIARHPAKSQPCRQ